MYVCVCKAVTEDKLKEQAKKRKQCAKDVCRGLGVGGECGVCFQKAMSILDSHIKQNSTPPKKK